jgi:hypothetical protein
MKQFILVVTIFALSLSQVWADDAAPAPKPAPAANSANAPSNRSKDIEFDDSVVEGMNKSGKDSLEMTSKNEDPNRAHLYHKRVDFKPELKLLSSEVGSQ